MRLRLEVANDDFLYAACAPRLPASDKFDPTGADRKRTMATVDDAMTRLSNTKALNVEAILTANAAGGEGGVWEHPLSRRKFKFAEFTGVVDEFRLSCVRQSSRSAVSETTQWERPGLGGPCTLRAYGRGGATFKLIEEW